MAGLTGDFGPRDLAAIAAIMAALPAGTQIKIGGQGLVTAGGYEAMGVATGLTAAGTTQATATALAKQKNVFSTVAAGAGAILPNAGAGVRITIINRGASALLVYPLIGGIIDALAANAAFSVAAGTVKGFEQVSATQFYSA